ncbi:MAG: hypothetical protein WC323_03790 [Patescibacteria group bacterium]
MATLAVNTNWNEVDFGASGLQDLVIRNPKEAGRQFTAFLKNGGRVTVVASFPTFKTIRLGTLKDADAIRKAIADVGGRISDRANDILGQPAFTVATKETEVELVVVSVAELGFNDGTRYSAICERAKQLNLALCPAEVGPQLRLQYADQPASEWLHIAMEPITGSGGDLSLFLVGRVGRGLWLIGSRGHPRSLWYGNRRFVFVRRK